MINRYILSKDILKSIDSNGEVKIIGQQTAIQWANAFNIMISSNGIGEINSTSKLPSLKSSWIRFFAETKTDNKVVDQIRLGPMLLNSVEFKLKPRAETNIMVMKNAKPSVAVPLAVKDKNNSLFKRASTDF